MPYRAAISRESPIPLEEWLAYVAASEKVELTPPRTGINPFTRQPTEFYPAAGSAFVLITGNRCSIAFDAGTLRVDVTDDEMKPVAEEIARDLRCHVEFTPADFD